MGMKTLLILRHAKSSWGDPGLPDHERPLNQRGKRDAPRIGRLVREEGIVPDLIISSTARRAESTAKKVADQSGYHGEIQFDKSLYHGDPASWIAVLSTLPDQYDRVMVVGHNPGLEGLLKVLAGEVKTLPTAALANVSLSIETWQQLRRDPNGVLVRLWIPRELE